MRWIRGSFNAVLMVTLVKPVVRRMVGRWRRRAQESPATMIAMPMQGLLETALMEELAATAGDGQQAPVETSEQPADGGMGRTLLIVGVVVVVAVGVAVTVAAVNRRRREGEAEQSEDAEWVAVPVEASIEEPQEGVAQGTLVE